MNKWEGRLVHNQEELVRYRKWKNSMTRCRGVARGGNLADQLTLFKPRGGGQIMPVTLLPPPRFKMLSTPLRWLEVDTQYTSCPTYPNWLSLYLLVVIFRLCLSIYSKIIFPIFIDYLDVDVANFEDVAFPFSIEVGLWNLLRCRMTTKPKFKKLWTHVMCQEIRHLISATLGPTRHLVDLLMP